MKYKVGDRVKMRSLQWCKENIFNNKDKYPPEIFRGIEKFCGKILTISDAVDKSKHVDEGYYNMVEDTKWEYYWTDEMIEGLVEDETALNKWTGLKVELELSKSVIGVSNIESLHGERFMSGFIKAIIPPEGYIFKDENDNIINATKIVLKKKEKEYPKTFRECQKYLGEDVPPMEEPVSKTHRRRQVHLLEVLLTCRDAYWKLYGEEIGLDGPWKPIDNSEVCYGIFTWAREIYHNNTAKWCILTFPTAEMRNTFYENFKELINECKELL